MPDDARNDQIERAINREVAGALSIRQHGASTFLVAPRSMSEVMEFAKLMSVSGVCIRPTFRGNPGACLAITLQAMKWGADPFAVANKAFEVNGQLSYEAQLIHAIVNSSPVLEERLHASYLGEAGQRQCLVTGMIKGETNAREYLSPRIGDITPKNSPLWKTDPDQQLFYYSTRAWARRWVPEILLGIYAPDELTIEHDDKPPRPTRSQFVDERQERIEALADPDPAETGTHPQDRKEERPNHPHTQTEAGSPQEPLAQMYQINVADPPPQKPLRTGLDDGPPLPRPRKPRATKLEMEARRRAAESSQPRSAAQIVNDAAARDAQEFDDQTRQYAVVDPDGVVHDQFGNAAEAAAFLSFLFTQARGHKAIVALVEDNGELMVTLSNQDPVAFRMVTDARTAARQKIELAAEAPATTQSPHGTDDAPEPDRQAPAAPPPAAGAPLPADGLQDRPQPVSSPKLPAGAVTGSYVIDPVYLKSGALDPRWWGALFIPKLEQAKSSEEFARLLVDNAETIAAHKRTLTPPAIIAAMKEIDDIERRVPA